MKPTYGWVAGLMTATLVSSQDWLEVREDIDAPYFRTEPRSMHQLVEIATMTQNTSLLAPGMLFFAPTFLIKGFGPKIYTTDGLMIWDGADAVADISQQFYACRYKGSGIDHLCWHESSALGIHRKGETAADVHDYHRVFDNTYTQVGQNYSTTGDIKTIDMLPNFAGLEVAPAHPDSHEFTALGDGTTYVQAVYRRLERDLSIWGRVNDTKQGGSYILDSCFQEVEFDTERVVFSWCYLDWLEMETNLYLNLPDQKNFTTGLAGDGSWFGAWDFWHINSIDKNEEGDYLISGRHADQIMKIAGPNSALAKPGTPLWRLGGPSNQFKYTNDFNFTRQHDARFMATTAEWTTFSIHDNAWEGEGGPDMVSANASSAKILAVNNVTMEARLIQAYYQPDGLLCQSGGNVQILPNGNIFVGWGYKRQVTEFHPDGRVLMHARLLVDHGPILNNYRNFKMPWVGRPAHPPKLIAYSSSCRDAKASPLYGYVSWNGDTETKKWRFSVSARPGFWIDAGTFDKSGFETKAVLTDTFYPHVHVEALDAMGMVIGRVTVDTFVPDFKVVGQGQCDKEGCFNGTTVDYPPEFNCAQQCWKSYQTDSVLAVAVLIVAIELLSAAFTTLMFGPLTRIRGSIRWGEYVPVTTRGDHEYVK